MQEDKLVRRLVMRTVIFMFCIAQFWLVVNVPAKGQSDSRPLEQHVARFAMVRADIHVALQHLATTYKVPIGLEMIPEKEEDTKKIYFDLDLQKCSVGEILNAIVDRDNR